MKRLTTTDRLRMIEDVKLVKNEFPPTCAAHNTAIAVEELLAREAKSVKLIDHLAQTLHEAGARTPRNKGDVFWERGAQSRTLDHVAKHPLVGDIIKFAETTEEVGGFCEVMHVSEHWIGYRNHSDDRPEWNTPDEWAEDCRKPNCSLIRGGDHDFPF